jgi:nucleosome binding factor SPN SPT16 subunit
LHLFLLGYEDFTDSIIVITRGNFYFLSSSKKCQVLQQQLSGKGEGFALHFIEKSKDDAINGDNFNRLITSLKKTGVKNFGYLAKEKSENSYLNRFLQSLDENDAEKVDITAALGLFFAGKDETELDLCKRAAIMSNKVMKHGFIERMESILEDDKKVKHSDLAKELEGIITDPSKINLNIAADILDSCYEPIIQSGGEYDIRINASSNNQLLAPNVIICSLGARYKNYCATMARTFLVDAPAKIENTYKTLLALYLRCLEQMVKGHELKDVYEGAKAFLKSKDPSLLSYLPKSLGFAMGLEFRDGTMVLNQTNTTRFQPNMVFNLSVGFHNIPLTAEDLAGCADSYKGMTSFSLLIADMVVIQVEGVADILTKTSREFGAISYNIASNEDNDDEDDEEEEEEEDRKEKKKKPALSSEEAFDDGIRRSTRFRQEKEAQEQATANRLIRQREIFEKKVQEAQKLIASGGWKLEGKSEEIVIAKDLQCFKKADDFPKDMPLHRIHFDADHEVIFVPIQGRHVPFHLTAIKQMTYSEPDLRINFHGAGQALPKDINPNMRALILKYQAEGFAFLKECIFRSYDARHMTTVMSQFQETRKKMRMREMKAEQDKGLVEQAKLIRIKDQRVPRLQDVTMRPAISGRKTLGTLEAHQNGLRFTSSKAETIDILYTNIKHAIYQPCDKSTMVLIHFHLKDGIMVGKKKQQDIQFFTEAVEASLNLENNRRYGFDPDEIEEEQREREMKRRLNLAFKEFCLKVQKVAEHYEFSLDFDAPYKKSSFYGNPGREMVLLLPTANCLVNLTEWPPTIITLSEVDHVHMERVTFSNNKNFDMTFIFKDWNRVPKTISAIDNKFMDIIMDWLNAMELTFTRGKLGMNWVEMLKIAKEFRDDGTFYQDRDPDGEKKPVGWNFLSVEQDDSDDEDPDEEESDYAEDSDDESEEESDDDDDDSDDSDLISEDDESDYNSDEEEGLEEKGMDWDELEREALASDRKRERDRGEEDDEDDRKRGSKKAKTAPPPSKGSSSNKRR